MYRKLVNLRILAGSVAFAVFTGVLMTNIFGNQVLFGAPSTRWAFQLPYTRLHPFKFGTSMKFPTHYISRI